MLIKTIQRTLRVPRSDGPAGDGSAVARQLDAALVSVGFKASRDLFEHLGGLTTGAALDLAVDVVTAVRGLVGDHVEHNPYFQDFPAGVPDTVEFWIGILRAAEAKDTTLGRQRGPINLLSSLRYGRVQHSYAEMLDRHDALIDSIKDRVTVVYLGGTAHEEVSALYRSLAGATTPLTGADLTLLGELAGECLDLEPGPMPVRENRATVNAARLLAGRPLLAVDSVVDVLRIACQLSGGDVTLVESTRFRRFRRAHRRALMAALDAAVAAEGGKLGDVNRYAGRFKRLGEYLHPHEYPAFPHAQDVFAVARGDLVVRSLAGRAEAAFARGAIGEAARLLTESPGMLLRSLDRLLRTAGPETEDVLDAVGSVLDRVSGRVLCSVREHLANRTEADPARVFVNRAGRPWVTRDDRPPLSAEVVHRVCAMVDVELMSRMPVHERLVIDPDVLAVALPLSGKAVEDGFAVLPRGTRTPVDGRILRFFTYWKQKKQRTDYDLSALLLDEDFQYIGHVSWTDYRNDGAVYSGDLTEAPRGATEFIDIQLGRTSAAHVVPQVSIYTGEDFDVVDESMFGWMVRESSLDGAPFEARTVRTRSDLRGSGRVALPMMFSRDGDGWTATWLHLYLKGAPGFNRVEGHHLSTAMITRAIASRAHLTVGHLLRLVEARAGSTVMWEPGLRLTEPVTFVGVHRPDGLPEGSTVITLDRLSELIPR
ncbi:hypothetical protein JOD54_004645 [Actinokineospora baliensis]|uniref:TerD family protein n=1 Tax=Actinokineospora baliensis TaxID=547056 RepID=UPI00195C32B7|nr:TerD family protein [Actinokineospora baliensis]MBM7774441.1 hypothetical protein [Actinokineospora baliensis]